MQAGEIALRLAVGALLTLANAFFVVSEFALTRLRQLAAGELEGDCRLERAWKMTERLEIYLTGCQLGITTSSILLGVVAEPAVTRLIRPAVELAGAPGRAVPTVSVALAVVVINLVHKIWGEQAPTYLGVERPGQVIRWTAAPLAWWTRVMSPAIYFGDGMAKLTLRLFGVEIERSWMKEHDGAGRPIHDFGELRREMSEVLSRGSLPRERRREVLQALEIDEIRVRDVMVPRRDVVALSTARPAAENFATLARQAYSRLPLVGESLEDFRGIVYVPALFRELDDLRSGATELAELAAPPFKVPADRPVSRLIDDFQKARQELALVEEGGEIVGLVTSTDAFEAIAGELEDPYD